MSVIIGFHLYIANKNQTKHNFPTIQGDNLKSLKLLCFIYCSPIFYGVNALASFFFEHSSSEEFLKQGCKELLIHEINPMDEHARRVNAVLSCLKENRFPTFWVSRELLDDLQAAKLPANADLDQIRWPIPGGVFLFRPRGCGPKVGVPFLSFTLTDPLKERDPLFPPTSKHKNPG